MGFRQGAYARLWSAEDKGRYSLANISVSKKNKDTNKYETEFLSKYVRLVGNAHDTATELDIPANGVSIKITSCDVTNQYDPQKERMYTNFVVFGFEIPDDNDSSGSSNKQSADKGKKRAARTKQEQFEDEKDLPF